jgi:DNA-directed RNA polymerase II subunit RPB1
MNSNKSKTVQPSRIIGIQFGLLSPESIKRNSVVQVESRDTYINNKPVTGGLFDPRMGVLEPGLICPTDGLTYIDTPGYFGHIELARPVLFIQHLKEILKIIKCICFKCSKLRINKSQHLHTLSWNSSKRWDYVCGLASSVKRCGDATEDGCGCKQPDKIKQEGIGSIYAIWENISTEDTEGNKDKTKITMKLTPENIMKIFRRISDDDITFMGFSPIWSRPEWMICSVLPVPPPAVRPSVKHDAQQRSEDDLTHIYSNIIKTNKDLLDKIQNNASPNVIDGLTAVLQYLVAMIVNNKVKGAIPMSQRSGRPLQCISGRLNSKNGRIRGNLMGKRVDFSARSVITGDPNLSIRQLGVPLKVAKNITKPVVVNERNRNFLLKLIQNGPDVHPGAKILEKKNGDSISLRNVDRASIRLEDGDIVHRHMMDGDAVLFNRQPSLHRVSMMCHIVKVMKIGDTFRINVGVTKPYNADFDGDEMNMHMPQNVLAETELRHLAAIPYQMISPSGNAPIIGIYQDSMLGSYRFTREKMNLTPKKAMNLLMSYPRINVDALYNKRKNLTNFDVLSQIIPPLTLKYSKESNKIAIQNGEYLSGQMEKSVLASTSKGIIHRIYNDYGYMPASNFVDDLQGIITEYMKTSSFSVGISDLIANKKTQEAIIQAVNTQKMEVQSIIQKVHLGIFKNETANSNSVEFEKSINNILNKATEQSGKIGRESLSRDNRFLIIVESGSKGSLVNISQMIACVGQQNVDGKRVPYGFDSRTLPHFTKFDDSETARGFVENSYISGLTAPELFFHAMGGRIGLIDTAVKTSQTGYIQRRLIKSLEDKKIENDMTVRNNMGKIIQFAYGDDGFDSTKVENQTIPLVGMSIEDIYMHYDLVLERGQTLDVYTKGTASRMSRQSEELKIKNHAYIEEMIDNRDSLVENVFKYRDENSVSVPVAFHFTIANIAGQLQLGANSTVDITPLEAYEIIEFYMTKLEKLYFSPPTKLFKILYYFYLSPRELLINKRFHRKALEMLLETIVLKYKQALVHPGEMVGVIAGQSIGEPTTQLTLNSVTYETEILVRNSKKEVMCVQIGKFTQDHIYKSHKIDYNQTKDTTYAELSDEDEFYEIPCATENGETVWRRIEAVTKHPVVNEDGTNTMLKVTTKGCHEVIATKAKSFLQLVDGKIIGVNGKDLKVGQYLPVSKKALDYNETFKLNLREILPPKEYLYGSDYKKAEKLMHEHNWWHNHSGKDFVLPHSRSDLFVSLVKSNKNIDENCVYMKVVNKCDYMIPDKIQLDYDFGYFLGAYCAEGFMTKHQISISNNDIEYFKPIQQVCDKFNVKTKVYRVKNKKGWVSQDIRIYNTVLCRIVDDLCGKLSDNKFVSPKIVYSNRECIMGFLDAYIGGNIPLSSSSKCPVSITMTSVSMKMLLDISLMLKNFGILSKIDKSSKILKNRGSKNIKQHYILSINNQQAQGLASMLNLPIKSKQERIKGLIKRSFKYEYSKEYLSLPNMVDGKIIFEPRGNMVPDLVFEEIMSIEEVSNTTNYAYDLTVLDTRNFDTYYGVCCRDTFHLAGVASKSNVTRGVPRIEEILRLTKNPKNPSLTIYINDEDNQERATSYATMLEHTKLVDVVKSVQICFDPNENASFMEDDRELIEKYYEFENMINECNSEEDINFNSISGGGSTQVASYKISEIQKSKWIIRMEFNAEKMLDKNITMDDIHFAINATYSQEISCVYSDFNMENLVFRIRLNSDVLKKNNKKGGLHSLDQSDEIYLLKNFQDMLLNNIVLRGISGIQNVIPRKLQNMVTKKNNTISKRDGKYVTKDTWVLDTTGTNLLETLAIDFIDYKRTYSNDIREVFNVLGIEAARQVIYNEFVEVMEFSGVYINYHHLSLLCDRMTLTPDMVPIFRSGILNDDIGPLAKATFEVHTEVFLDAARHGEFDDMRGVSANVMCGQYGKYGTNMFNVILDMNEMVKLKESNIVLKTEEEEIEEMFGLNKNEEDICSKIEIRSNISTILPNGQEICDDGYDMGF